MTSILITGANRGLGLEFTRQGAAAGWRVFACCRNPGEAESLKAIAADAKERVSLHRLDVKDFSQIESLARDLRDEPIDILLNNAGIYGPQNAHFGQTDYRAWAEVFAVNVMAPMKMAECFIDHVARSERKVIIGLSSLMGSIGETHQGQHYLYRSSKAALNMVVKTLALDLRDRSVTAVVLHPGWVQTDMGGAQAPLKPPESIRGMLKVINGLTIKQTGRFFSHDGSEIPW
jgi:NAD(P)-dependent dehydrogenase (short-subunit alcohol dehydrogenase family)